MPPRCSHLDTIVDERDPADVCEDCVAEGTREWHHLRQCRACGMTRCCDQSPNRHASRHFRASGHPIMRSAEPEEDWHWCYVDETIFRQATAP
jgi:hypothetical protein